jgi:hypothetical protein
MSEPTNSARISLYDVLRENSAKRPAASAAGPVQWKLVPEGIKPLPPVAVDCQGSEPDFDSACHNKPVWVIEDAEGYYPTCLTHSGKVLNGLLVSRYSRNAEVSLYFHAYKGE